MTIPRGLMRVTAVFVGVTLVSACGGGDDAGGPGASTTSTIAEPPAGASASSTVPVDAPQIPDPVQHMEIAGTEYAFALDTANNPRSGWTLVQFANIGEEAHQVMFARLRDDVDLAELAEAGAGDSSGSAAIEFVDMIGGVSYIGAGQETTALVDLPAGVVLAMCYVPTPEGEAHALLGMTTSLAVTDPDDPLAESAVAEPIPDDIPELADRTVQGTIELAADGYEFPTEMPTGWYHVVNNDDADLSRGLHELALLKMSEPVDGEPLDQLVTDLADNIVPDIELEAIGGLGAVSAGFEGYLYIDLEPGHYLAVDFMPDPGDPRPHMLDGYYARFDVD